MIKLTKQETLYLLQLWNTYGSLLDSIIERMIENYESQIVPGSTEWESAKQTIDYLAKKTALIQFKKLLSNVYTNE